MIDTKSKNPATDEELKKDCRTIKRHAKNGDLDKMHKEIGAFHYNHGKTVDRETIKWEYKS